MLLPWRGPAQVDPDPTLGEPAGPAPSAADARGRRTTAIGLALSVALHLLGLGAMAARGPDARRAPPSFEVIDLDIAPLAPKAEALPPEEEVAAATRPPTPAPTVPTVPEPDGLGLADAGVADAAVDAPLDAAVDAAVDARVRPDGGPRDGGPRDGGLDGGSGAGAGADDGGLDAPVDAGVDAAADAALVATADLDGGVGDAASATALASDAGTSADGGAAIASASDAGPTGDGGGVADGGTAVATTGTPDRSGSPTAHPSAGTAANLLAYAPAGHVVTLLVRLDRLRGTRWADHVEAMLAPLPDHDALIGDQAVRITDVFETLVVSSFDPARADATTLAARSNLPPAAVRALLDRPDAPVRWTPTRGGALGRRQPSPSLIVGDARVFLAWAPGWTTLAQPADLGDGMLAPATIGLDHAFANPAVTPPWLARVATIEDESGTDAGPALMVTAGGMFPAAVDVPLVDVDLPGPERATLTLTITATGFDVRGNLRYRDEAAAATAADALLRVKRALVDNPLAALALRTARAWNAVNLLDVRRTGARVAFSTAINAIDGQVLLGRVTDLIAARFSGLRQRRPAPAPRPASP